MGEFLKKVIWFTILVALAYCLYVAYVRWWDTGAVADVQQKIQNYFTKKTGEVKTEVEQKTKEYTSEVVGEAKKTVLDAVKEQISQSLTGLGQSMMRSAESLIGASSTGPGPAVTIGSLTNNASSMRPVSTSSDYLAPAPPATLITRVDAPLVFSINRGATYTIDWGDSLKDSGTVTQELVKLVSHTWMREGDYTVLISVKGGGVSQNYSFPIRVYP